MGTRVSHPLLYSEKKTLQGKLPLITTSLRCEAELGHPIIAIYVYSLFSLGPILSASTLLVKVCFFLNVFERYWSTRHTKFSGEGNSCLWVFPEMSVIQTLFHHTQSSTTPNWHSSFSATLTQSTTVAQHRNNFPIRSVGVLSRTNSSSYRWVGCGQDKL